MEIARKFLIKGPSIRRKTHWPLKHSFITSQQRVYEISEQIVNHGGSREKTLENSSPVEFLPAHNSALIAHYTARAHKV